MPENTENKLPESFNGVFYFTNPTDTEFVDYWNSVKYTFPPHKTVPLIIPDESPLGIQEIRKKFAKNLATNIFYNTDKYRLREEEAPAGSGKTPAIFTAADLEPYIQMCIQPLPMDTAKVERQELDQTERRLRTDEHGKRRTRVLREGESLIPDGATVL